MPGSGACRIGWSSRPGHSPVLANDLQAWRRLRGVHGRIAVVLRKARARRVRAALATLTTMETHSHAAATEGADGAEDFDGSDGSTGHPPSGRRLALVRAGELTADTAQTSGMGRFAAISGCTVGSQSLWMGLTHLAPGATSGTHHHGESETAIYVVSGHPAFVFVAASGDGAETRLETSPGDFVFVPPHTPHREENPSADKEAVVVIARSTQDAIVVNLDLPVGETAP
jgi:uncharacterized RmlC-like cupin family protein